MDGRRLMDWFDQQIHDALYRSQTSHAPEEREHWNRIVDEYIASKHALERAIAATKKGVVRR
jgi:hypothetical protein